MRRLILQEPISRAALWSRRLTFFALLVAGMAVGLSRFGFADVTAALSILASAIILGCVGLLLAGAACVVIWNKGLRGTRHIVVACFYAAVLLAYPAWLSVQAIRLPALADVSTDLNDPPDFSRSSRAASLRGAVTHDPIPQYAREAQRRAYPQVQPILVDLEGDEAWQIVQKALEARKWQVIDQVQPGGRARIGHIDAVDRSLVMGFAQDVTIRLRPLAGQTRIDIRSASRIGKHDFGDNARRIQRFAQELQAQLDAR
jgi:uncharacterized protein (DUF1499 family)